MTMRTLSVWGAMAGVLVTLVIWSVIGFIAYALFQAFVGRL